VRIPNFCIRPGIYLRRRVGNTAYSRVPKFADGGAGAKLEVSDRDLCKLNWRRGVWKLDIVSFRKSRIIYKECLPDCFLLPV